MKKVKVLYLIAGFLPGGAELMLRKIINRINQDKFDISICFFGEVGNHSKVIKKKVNKIFNLEIENNNIFHIIKGYVRLRKLIKNEKPQILHSFMIKANLIGRFATIGEQCKFISSIRVKLKNKTYFPILLLDRISQRYVNKYVVNSKELRKFTINHGIKERKIILIENGLEFEKFKNIIAPEKLKKELKLSNLPLITMIAHFRKQKDYPTMISALAYLKKDIDFNFLSVGTKTTNENELYKVKRLVNKLDLHNIYFLGFRNDIPDILSITDIWVSSTLFEGQSNSLLEAMVMKKSIVTTNIPENAEVVRNGKEALLVPTKSPKILANTIKTLLNDKTLAEKLANNAYKRVIEKYNIDKTIYKLERLYNSLCS